MSSNDYKRVFEGVPKAIHNEMISNLDLSGFIYFIVTEKVCKMKTVFKHSAALISAFRGAVKILDVSVGAEMNPRGVRKAFD